MAGYHKSNISKGTLGEASKITEEYLEFMDAVEQGSKVMELVELSDLIGATEEYLKKYNLTIQDLIGFSDITKRAFKNGARK